MEENDGSFEDISEDSLDEEGELIFYESKDVKGSEGELGSKNVGILGKLYRLEKKIIIES